MTLKKDQNNVIYLDLIPDVIIIVTTMRLEWDENKNRENLQKHGFDFADAWQLFKNPLLVKPDIRKSYGEDRWIGIGTMNNGIIVVFVFTKRNNEITRIISMRKASKKERRNYEKNIKN